jgi:hypothetical protein
MPKASAGFAKPQAQAQPHPAELPGQSGEEVRDKRLKC